MRTKTSFTGVAATSNTAKHSLFIWGIVLLLPFVLSVNTGEASQGFLRASGKQIVDGQGNNVLLRGVGIGNWMLQEPYMLDASGIVENQQQFKARLEELVGPVHTAAFYEAWLTNYFTAADVREMAERGFNSIRLPMHYALFTLSVDQEPVPGQHTWIETGFNLVNNLLEWCASNRIYLILDMHACPGGQGRDKPISDYNPPAPSLWESAANREKLVALWREIARRYATNEWIGGYDLINEPNWTFENRSNVNGCDDQTNAPLRQLLIELTTAIREVDTNHIIFLTGNCWGNNYSGLLPPWDSNLVISFHKYWDAPDGALQKWIDMRNQWNMPVWLGESGENSNEWFREVVRLLEQANIGWAWWPWKKVGTISGTVTINKPAGYEDILNYWRNSAPRPSTNAAASALLAFAQASRLENCILHPDVFDALLRPETQSETIAFTNHSIPGRIFAAQYDLGAKGEAYFDTSTNNPVNSGGRYRNDSVDIETTDDIAPSIGYSVGWIEAGEWMKYSVASFQPGAYALRARVASGGTGGQFYIETGNSNVSGMIDVPGTGGWQDWVTLPARIFTNRETATAFKLVVVTGGFNLNWMQFDRLSPGAPGNLSASATQAAIELNWNPASAATSYHIQRANANGSDFTIIASNVTATTYLDRDVTNGMSYTYVITAAGPYGEGTASVPVEVTLPAPLLIARYTGEAVALSWPATASSYTLYATSLLSSPTLWCIVTNPVLFEDELCTVLLSVSEPAKYFRLAGP